MNKRHQQGQVARWVCAIAATVFLLCLAYEAGPASPDDVKALVAKAEASPAAMAVLQEGLKNTPTPTRDELTDLREKVNERLMLETSRALTGDPSLRSSTEIKVDDRRKRATEANKDLNEALGEHRFLALLLVPIVFGATVVGVRMFKVEGH